jgi:hypothetical protein
MAAVNSCCQAVAQGHSIGRCSVARRADRLIRAAMLINWARMVAVVALAWKVEASVPAARVRLNASAARTSQAEFAAKLPEVIWSHSVGVHDVREEGSGRPGPIVDAVICRRPSRRRKVSDAGATGAYSGVRGGVLDAARR